MAVALTLKKEFLAEAILAKSTPLYAQKDNYKGYNFKNDIFPQARFQFREYAKKYETDEEFTKYFARDLRNGDKKLFETIGSEAAKQILAGKTAEEAARAQALTEEASMQGAGEASTEQQSTAGEQASTMGGGSNAPYMPSGPAIYNTPGSRIILKQQPVSGMAGGTGTGTAATNKAAQLQAEKIVSEEPGITQKTSESDNLKSRNSGKPSLSESFRTPRISGSFVNAFKNFGSKAGVFFQRNIGKYLTVGRAAAGISAGIGAVAGAGFGPLGVGAGAIGGAIMPSWIRSGGAGKFFGRVGNGIINVGSSISNQIGGRFKVPKIPGVGNTFGGKKALLLLLPFLAFGILAGVLGALNPGGMPTGNTTSSTVALASDISQCKFTRAGDGPNNQKGFQSQLLLSYIQEASQLANIPPVVLAAFIRVESPSSLNMSDDQVRRYNCIFSGPEKNVSPTGALGVMQIQPEGTTGNDRQAISNGAKLVGKKYEELTNDDYCNVRENIIIGAGFILKKLQQKGFGDGTGWDPSWNNNKAAIYALVDGYYGCITYPSCTTGPYSYGDDVYTSIQNCTVSNLANVPPGSPASHFVFYCQGNTSWQNTCSLGEAGCGPSSMAMVLGTFGINMTPPQADATFQSNKWRSCNNSDSLMTTAINSNWFKDLGFEVGSNISTYIPEKSKNILNMTQAKDFIDKGYLIIGSSDKFPIVNAQTKGAELGHIFVVDNVDTSANTVDIRDPNNCSYSDGDDEIQANRTRKVDFIDWKYAYPVKKVR